MSKCDIINSVNKIKWLFREYGALNVTEVFMYRMKPLNLRGGSVVECRTPEREVGGSKPTAAVLCP